MILDYLFFRVYEKYLKFKNEGEPLGRSRGYLMVILQIFIFPIGINIAVLYGRPNSLFNLVPYILISVLIYMAICKRYNKHSVERIIAKYNRNNNRIPIFLIWFLLPVSVICAFVFAVLVNYYVMGPLGVIGLFLKN